MKNKRVEQCTSTDTFTGLDGTDYNVSYVASEGTVGEADCRYCGQEYTVRGLSEIALEMLGRPACPDCRRANCDDLEWLL